MNDGEGWLVVLMLVVLIFNVVIGSMALGYCCEVTFGRRPHGPILWIGGLITGEVTVPLAVVLWLLVQVGVVHPPFVH